MKKIVATVALTLAAGVAFSAAKLVSTGDFIKTADCAYIPSSNGVGVKLATSANVAAVYECTSTGVVTGAAHTQGKKNAYLSTSAGGSQVQSPLTANPSATNVDITTLLQDSAAWTGLVGALT